MVTLTTVTGAKGDHVRTLHDAIVAQLCESAGSAGVPFKGGYGNTCKNIFAHCIHHNLVSDDDERHLQGIIPNSHPASRPTTSTTVVILSS